MADRCNICRLAGGRHRLDCPRFEAGQVTFVPTPTPSDRLLAACRKLKAARDERRQRVHDLQAMAAESRRGRPLNVQQFDREHPTAWNISDVVDEICAAMEEVDHG